MKTRFILFVATFAFACGVDDTKQTRVFLDRNCEVEQITIEWWDRTHDIQKEHITLLRCIADYWRTHYERGTKPGDLPPIKCHSTMVWLKERDREGRRKTK